MYLPPYNRLSECLKRGEDGSITLPKEVFQELLKVVARAGILDEAWYRAAFQDVAEAIESGTLPDGVSHFAQGGYFEGRAPRNFEVDEAWYLSRYPDVQDAIECGDLPSAHGHFNTTGYAEGRVPTREHEAEVEAWNGVIDRHSSAARGGESS